MDPIIYALPNTDIDFDSVKINVEFNDVPNSKLIKFGFNSITDLPDMLAITSVPNYRVGLEFDFERTDKMSIKYKGSALFGVDNVDKFNATFCEMFEIFFLFGFLNSDQNILNLTNSSSIDDIINCKLVKSNYVAKYNVIDNINDVDQRPISLVISNCSTTDIDENAVIDIIINEFDALLKPQTIGCNMILQFYALQTQMSIEIIKLLNILYTEVYIIKPITVSDLSDCKYIVALSLRHQLTDNVSVHRTNMFPVSLGLGLGRNINSIEHIVQCYNSAMIPKKYALYNRIKAYVDDKVYDGATFEAFLEKQKRNVDQWLATFSDIINGKKLLDMSIQQTDDRCKIFSQIN